MPRAVGPPSDCASGPRRPRHRRHGAAPKAHRLQRRPAPLGAGATAAADPRSTVAGTNSGMPSPRRPRAGRRCSIADIGPWPSWWLRRSRWFDGRTASPAFQSGDPATTGPQCRNGAAPASFPGPGGPCGSIARHPVAPGRAGLTGPPRGANKPAPRRPPLRSGPELRPGCGPARPWRSVAVKAASAAVFRPNPTGAPHDPSRLRLRPPRQP